MGIDNGFMVSRCDILAFISIGILGILLLLCFNLVVFSIWRSYRIKHDKKGRDEDWYDLAYFKDSHFGADVIVTIIGVVCLVIMWAGLIVCGIQAYQNTKIEHVCYDRYETEYSTLVNITNNSGDVVNTGIYLRINEYNKEVSRLQSQYNDKNFSINFSGDYDWNAMPLINLGGKS